MNKRKLNQKIDLLLSVIQKQDATIKAKNEQIAQLTQFTHEEMIEYQVNKILSEVRES